MIQAIQTTYQGYKFRSRLEARWAVFFDALGLKWEYEPEGFDLGSAGWYLPDFLLQTRLFGPVYVEVKPTGAGETDWSKAKALGREFHNALLLAGVPRTCCHTLCVGPSFIDRVPTTQWVLGDNELFVLFSSEGLVYSRDFADNRFDSAYLSACGAARAARFESGPRA